MLTAMLAAAPAAALQTTAAVEAVVSASGVRAYLMREPTIPFLSLALHVRGGSATDPAGKEGLAFMTAGLLDEGAGPYDSQAFRALGLQDRPALLLGMDSLALFDRIEIDFPNKRVVFDLKDEGAAREAKQRFAARDGYRGA